MSHLERAITIAVEAHKGQLDKADKPYILHPLRLMLKMKAENEMIVAVLHDLVEDCDGWDFERLEGEGFSGEVINALKLLTHNKKESYDRYIEKIKTNPLALKVKIADLEDNLDIKRIAHTKFKDYGRLAHYMKYYNELKELI